ncbi:hypothetical protein SKAU_G00212740 [Synaphobranchus kaupii]|uniref:Uncharacterized protein n=2 Tax=Anguilliformes TaxID=7933 RepID=A0A9Q1F9G3_SYNKA|nr:hypothetical protein SKAU_G00212740 [Synaphobranchus kaupii]
MQPKAGGKLHLRLNTGTRPIVDNPPGGFNSAGQVGRAGAVRIPSRDRPPAGPVPRRAHFLRGGAPRPALGRLGRVRGEGGSSLRRRALQPLCHDLAASPGAEGDDRCRAFPATPSQPRPPLHGGGGGVAAGATARDGAPRLRRDCRPGRTVLSAHPTASRRRAGTGPRTGARGLRRCRQPTRPVLKHGPRSLTRARVRGPPSETPWRNESEGRRAPAEVGSPPAPPLGCGTRSGAHHRPVSPALSGRWSVSACDRTRKMVNYAWAGRSQRKLWWRSAAVLTCKSVVRPGYRGERLIEPSSSWFPPKFPSG